MPATPRDTSLYAEIKKRVSEQYGGKWSAYASGSLVQQYKREFRKKHGSRRSPYIDGAKSRDAPLATWFRENWVDVKSGRPCGSVKTDDYYPTCRPRDQYESLTPSQRRRMVSRKQIAKDRVASYVGILRPRKKNPA